LLPYIANQQLNTECTHYKDLKMYEILSAIEF